jgi:hypothetical protein
LVFFEAAFIVTFFVATAFFAAAFFSATFFAIAFFVVAFLAPAFFCREPSGTRSWRPVYARRAWALPSCVLAAPPFRRATYPVA